MGNAECPDAEVLRGEIGQANAAPERHTRLLVGAQMNRGTSLIFRMDTWGGGIGSSLGAVVDSKKGSMPQLVICVRRRPISGDVRELRIRRAKTPGICSSPLAIVLKVGLLAHRRSWRH